MTSWYFWIHVIRGVILELCIIHCWQQHTLLTLTMNKRPNLALACASSLMAQVSEHKFLRQIALYNDRNSSRLINKRFCEWVDAETVPLTVRSISILKCFRSEDIRTSIKRRATKCLNLRSFFMMHEDVFIYLTSFDFLKELLMVSPGLLKIQSSHVFKW